jgi:hypothetical protein
MHNENLRGIAKSLTFYCYEAIAGDASPENASLKYTSVQKYNDRGQIIEYKFYHKHSMAPEYTDSYEYDQKGQLRNFKNESDDNTTNTEIYYDNEGNRIKERSYSSSELKYITTNIFKEKKLVEEDITDVSQPEHPLRRIYKYDSNGDDILFEIIDRTGKLIVMTTSEYDNKGRMLSFSTKNFEDNTIETGSRSYKYFPDGKLKEETRYSGKYALTKTIFDSNGNSLHEINYSGEGPNDVLSDEEFRYDKIDSHGNWTQRSRYNNGHRTSLEMY